MMKYDDVIDQKTGEILRTYESRPYEPNCLNVLPKNPADANSEQQLEDICRDLGEKASYNLILNIDEIKQTDLTNYVRILKLCDRLSYRNIVIMTRKELSELFKVNVSNLSRSLRRMSEKDLIKFTSENMLTRDLIKLFINPSLVWKGDSTRRLVKISEWYGCKVSLDLLELTHVDQVVHQEQDCDYKYDPVEYYESLYDPFGFNETPIQLKKILNLTDEEFSLFMLGELNI